MATMDRVRIPEIDLDYRAARQSGDGYAGHKRQKIGAERDRLIQQEVQRCRARIEQDRRRREARNAQQRPKSGQERAIWSLCVSKPADDTIVDSRPDLEPYCPPPGCCAQCYDHNWRTGPRGRRICATCRPRSKKDSAHAKEWRKFMLGRKVEW